MSDLSLRSLCERSVDRGDRQRGSGFSTAYSPLQNLRTYLQRQGVPAERAALLLEYARRLIGDDEGATDGMVPDEPAVTPLPLPSASPQEPEASLVL